jgi:hypothetical protein
MVYHWYTCTVRTRTMVQYAQELSVRVFCSCLSSVHDTYSEYYVNTHDIMADTAP